MCAESHGLATLTMLVPNQNADKLTPITFVIIDSGRELNVSRRITHRKICNNPHARCYRGVCIDCNRGAFHTIESIEHRAQSTGYGRDFIAGKINDFFHAEKYWETLPDEEV